MGNKETGIADRARIELADIKLMLGQFVAQHANTPARKLEADFGDLLLYLVRLADKAGVDLIESGLQQLDRKHKSLPRVVRTRPR